MLREPSKIHESIQRIELTCRVNEGATAGQPSRRAFDGQSGSAVYLSHFSQFEKRRKEKMECCICGKDLTGLPAMVDHASSEAFCERDAHYFGQHPSNRPQRLAPEDPTNKREPLAEYQKRESPSPTNKAEVGSATEPQASEDCSAENGRGAKTTDPSRALELLFGWALPAAPLIPVNEIQAMYNFQKESLGSESLMEAGTEDVRNRVLKTLNTLKQRPDFKTYRVEVDLKGLGLKGANGIWEKRKSAKVSIFFESTYACIFVFRSENKVFAFGTPHF